jgi:hypothetical protein
MDYTIPIYDIQIDGENLGVYATSLVERPAVEELFVILNEQIKLSLNEDKQILIGPALIPNKRIYRVHPKTKEEFYIKFSKETIEQIVLKFFKEGNHLNFNIEHSDKVVDGVIVESWIVGGENDKSKNYGFDLPEGTWMLSTYIENKDDWEKYVKTGEVKGYSIEGNFNLIKEEQTQELTTASNVVIIAEYDDLENDKLRSYLSVRELMNRIIILSDNPGVSKLQIRNQYGLFVDQVINNDYGRDLRSKLAWRAVKIAEIDNKYKIFEGITSHFRVADMYRKLGVRTVQPTRLSIKPEEAKELMKDIIKQYEKN